MIRLRTCATVGAGFALLGFVSTVVLGEGSETPDGSVVIPSLPFIDSGDTSDNFDNFDSGIFGLGCQDPSSIAPEVFYRYDADFDGEICVRMCESGYDTKVYILDVNLQVVACDDDGCSTSGGEGFRSIIENFPVLDGETYWIVCDGWGDESGPYEVIVDDCPPPPPACRLDCPAGATLEGEVCNDNGVPDFINGGCNTDEINPPMLNVNCGDSYCGLAWAKDDLRDTDWYRMTLTEQSFVSLTVDSQFVARFGYFMDTECGQTNQLVSITTTGECDGGETISTTAGPGEIWWFVASSTFNFVECAPDGNNYTASWSCGLVPCCELGDNNEDGEIGFDDLLRVLANWGACPTVP